MSRPAGSRDPGPAWRAFMCNLRHLCNRKGVTHEGIGRRLGCEARRVRRLLRGQTAPHIDDIAALARIFAVKPGDLAFGSVILPGTPTPPQEGP